MKYYLLVAGGMIAVIAAALAFEHIGGYKPCKLCLAQREPWYAGIPVAILAVLAVLAGFRPVVPRLLMLVVGLILVYSAWLGVHHSGVEWGWWPGPGDCGVVEGGISNNTEGLFQQLQTEVPPSCDDAPLRILGLSFAGWNAVASSFLAIIAFGLVARR